MSSTIEFNRREPGDTEEAQANTARLVRKLQSEQASLQAELARLENAQNRPLRVPTRGEIESLLVELHDILAGAATATSDDEFHSARQIIDDLVCGHIELEQMGERKKHRGWLRGRLTVDLPGFALRRLRSGHVFRDRSGETIVEIDFKAVDPRDELAEKVKELWDQDLLMREIAKQLKMSRSRVSGLFNHWFDSRGLPRPNNYKRRSGLAKKQTNEPAYQVIASGAVEAMNEGKSNLEIARMFKTSDATVSKSIAWWHRQRGMEPPTAKDRRAMKLQRALQLMDEGRLLKDIACELGYSARGLSLAISKYASERGIDLPDGRTRRGNAKSGDSANGQGLNDPES